MRIELERPLKPIEENASPGKRKMLESEEVSVIELREPYAGDLIELDKIDGDNRRSLKLLELLSGVSHATLCRLSLHDLKRVNEALDELMGKL